MHTKPKSLSSGTSLLAGSALAVALLLDAALSLNGLVPEQAALFPSAAASLEALAGSVLPPGRVLAGFASGIALALAVIMLPMHRVYRSREARLLQERERLAAQNAKLVRQAASDGLLGIANRREFERVLKLEWRRAARERQPLSLLMIDIDCFKLFNDSYGHQAGDTCLRGVADVLRNAAARPGDMVARYGGEEMVVLMPHTSLEGAVRMAERIHAMLAEHPLPFAASPVAEHVTVSIGVSSMLPVRNADRSVLVQQADEGLYAAKESGRNRTAVVPNLRLIAEEESRAWFHRAQGT
ncbi:GGDEF domain-containing protein [Billgrantia sulfidoxydans]|uniref:diguanylate cyclase n=1 Tax=Billgrantia sulfidoxydans TaxID=2733484 RepID=A0ABX7W274_9GAMM|nr:diguanylate cyclase [Halomonas sulfidoxydans]QTP53790.1 GGDEF domain-containing protein [Halomonas sulfidoxydans]